MEFYKLFHKRTNYHSMLEWIDRGFRPERWKLHDERIKNSLCKLLVPLILCNEIIKNFKN